MKFNFLDEIINMLTKLLSFNKKNWIYITQARSQPILYFECGPTYREQTLADIVKEENWNNIYQIFQPKSPFWKEATFICLLALLKTQWFSVNGFIRHYKLTTSWQKDILFTAWLLYLGDITSLIILGTSIIKHKLTSHSFSPLAQNTSSICHRHWEYVAA